MSKSWYKKYNNAWGYDKADKKTYGLFQTEMTGTTAVFGRENGIEVTFSGDKTFAQGNVINFPSLDLSMELDDDTTSVCRGFVDHHAAKVRFSDRGMIEKVQKENEKNNPLLWNIFNAVESVRVEEDYVDAYPGAMKNLAEMTNEQARVFKRSSGLVFNSKLPLSKIAPMALAAGGRKKMGFFGWNLSDIYDFVEKDERDRVADWVDKIFECGNTKESLDLSKEIYEYIKDNSKEEDKKDNNKPNEADGEGNEGFKYVPDLAEVVNSEIESNAGGSNVSSNNEQPPPYKIHTKKNDRVHHWSDPAPSTGSVQVCYEPAHNFGGAFMRNCGNITEYIKRANDLGPVINVARRKLELMIAAQRRVEWDYIKERGKFDSKRMTAAMANSPNVFKIKENAAEIDTAVSVVIDLSGSMNEKNKRGIATDTAIVLFECLSKIGIPFEIIGFDAAWSGADADEVRMATYAYQNRDGKCARYDALHTWVFKAFKDRPFDARPYLMGLGLGGVGGSSNADGESVLVAHQRLMSRPEKRKIMFVLSDGQPACHCTSGLQQQRYLKKAVEQMEKKGTHVVGIGIMTDAVKEFYNKYVICNNAKDLAGTALKLLSDVLLEKKK